MRPFLPDSSPWQTPFATAHLARSGLALAMAAMHGRVASMLLGGLMACAAMWGDPAKAAPVPDPAHYPASPLYTGKIAAPVLDSPFTRMYRTRIRLGAAAGPNFAGHYTVVAWGCGMDAYMFVVVDAITGKVYRPPVGCMALAGGFDLPLPGFAAEANPGYRPDSTLLLTIGVEDGPDSNPDDRAATIYHFERGHFKRIYRKPALLP
ncbi:hypothetical protein IGB42_04064 [Andreprevotia sp. IGB-42]|uniref:hypothetical protein n=1 Tax=Andreprevotia sp. IGB-42 TaxID=2497473 RepID=UPI00135A58D1|nr:hypothetical protein [Andreprevotia sp. IGB-42]KAF0811446.1 hypothetical protein IGB42_04064 [Andreprevotia sp. IGB-42]